MHHTDADTLAMGRYLLNHIDPDVRAQAIVAAREAGDEPTDVDMLSDLESWHHATASAIGDIVRKRVSAYGMGPLTLDQYKRRVGVFTECQMQRCGGACSSSERVTKWWGTLSEDARMRVDAVGPDRREPAPQVAQPAAGAVRQPDARATRSARCWRGVAGGAARVLRWL